MTTDVVRIKGRRRPNPRLWASPVPYGLGQTKPNHYLEILRTIAENWRHPRYAWRILTKGVCDGCALGVAGFRDWTIDSIHLCTTRLNLLSLNTMGALDPAVLGDVAALRSKSGMELRALGRLPYPMLRKRGDTGFTRISWDEALERIADAIRQSTAQRGNAGAIAFYLTARGILNETYYVAQKVARFIGTNTIDNAARICHAPSTGALKKALGVAATTISYTEVFASDLVVLIGSDIANSQPVFMKYLYMARKDGLKVAVINPLREPGLDRYWVPSNAESALFGTKMTDHFFGIHTGGDVAFLNGVLKVLIRDGRIDDSFIKAHTTGWPELRANLEGQSFEDLARWSGASLADMERFARVYARARSTIFVWSMGVTQHVCGTDNVMAIINLALSRGNVGRPGAGLMPVRGHSGVQGGAEMGAYSTTFPGGASISEESAAALSKTYGFEVPSRRGLSAAEMLEAAGRGEIDVLYSIGGNFLETLPDPIAVDAALARPKLRVHEDIVVSSQMLVDGEEVILLPATTRYEQPGGGTETTTERRIAFSPEIPGPRIGEARAEWQVLLELARRVDPERARLVMLADGQAIRDEIARVIPAYDGIQRLAKSGDQVQWGGERLCDGWAFPTPDGKAHFTVVGPRDADVPAGHFLLSTRRGKQFNSMVFKARDPLTGARRDDLFIADSDAARLGFPDGASVWVSSTTGRIPARVRISPIRPGNVQMFYPEANPLIPAGARDEVSLVPDYNAVVEITARRTPSDGSRTAGGPRESNASRAAGGSRASAAGSPGASSPGGPAGPEAHDMGAGSAPDSVAEPSRH